MTNRAKSGDNKTSSRLDSWKEIATYLGKSERTVKRWETERGLPVHRLPGGGRGSVHAYAAELTEWQSPRRALEREEDEVPRATGVDDEAERGDAESAGADELAGTMAAAGAARRGLSLGRVWTYAIAGVAVVGIAAGSARLMGARRGDLSGLPTGASLLATAPARSRSASSPPVSGSEKQLARELYLKGRYEWNERTPDSLNRALDDFMQAVVHNPNDAASYAGLADTYNLLQIYSTLPLTDSYPRAIAAARRAVELDDSLAEGHRALAFAEFYGAGQWRESEKEFQRAIDLEPKDAVTRRWYANAFAVPGRYDESIAELDKAQELDPTSHPTLADKGLILFNAGREDEGLALLREVVHTNPEFSSPHYYLMQIGLDRRDFRTFLEEGQKGADLRNDPVLRDIIAYAREGYNQDGDAGFLRNLYSRQKAYFEQGKISGSVWAKTCVAMGRRQEALHILEIAYGRRRSDALWVLTEPDLRGLRGEPGYQELIRKIDFPEYAKPLPAVTQEAEGSPHGLVQPLAGTRRSQ